MARDNTIDNLEEIARQLDERKPVFVSVDGPIHDAEKLSQEDTNERGPVTQLKPTTWYRAWKGEEL